MEKIGQNYKRLKAVEVFDVTGNLLRTQLDGTGLVGMAPQGVQTLKDFHQPISQSLASVAVPLPNKNAVAPMESWKATRIFSIATPDDDKPIIATYDLPYKYLGQRKRDGRDEAVIPLAGELQQIDGKRSK